MLRTHVYYYYYNVTTITVTIITTTAEKDTWPTTTERKAAGVKQNDSDRPFDFSDPIKTANAVKVEKIISQ